MNITLTDTEKTALRWRDGGAGGTHPDDPALYTAVEAILTARLAPIATLADEWVHPWVACSYFARAHAGDALRAALTQENTP
jgi:hypothetical protein